MSTHRKILESILSWRFFSGLLLGIVLGTAGIIMFARFQMAQSGMEETRNMDLEAPEIRGPERMISYGSVPDDWVLERPDGKTSTTFGEIQASPVVINKWATWCGPCKAEMPTLEALHDSTGQNVGLAVVTEQSADQVRRYLGNAGYTMPVYVVDSLPVSLRGRGIPRTYVVQPDGRVVYRHVGAADWNTAPVHGFLARITRDGP